MDESDGAIFDALRVRFLELRGMIRVLEVEKARLLDEITRNEELLHNKDQEKEQYTDALALKEEVLQRKETRLREMEQEKEQYTILLAEKEKELQEKGKDLREKELELLAMKQANKKYRETTDTRMPRYVERRRSVEIKWNYGFVF